MIRPLLIVALLLSSTPRAEAATKSGSCSGGLSWVYHNVFHKTPHWESCCLKHDDFYKLGGTPTNRLGSDERLFKCITIDNPFIASIVWPVVRIAGQAFFPFNWKRLKSDYSTQWLYNRSAPL